MREHQKEPPSLRHLTPSEGSNERRKLEQSIAHVCREQRCIQRVASVAALFLLLLVAGCAYGLILPGNFPYSLPELVFDLLYALGLASLICLVAFAGLLTVYGLRLNRMRGDCRRLGNSPLDPQLSKPHLATSPGSQGVSDDPEAFQGPAGARD